MNTFRRALNQSLHNPKYLLSIFAVTIFFGGIQIFMNSFMKNDTLNIVLTALVDALYTLSTLMLAVNISEDQVFSWKSLSRLPRALPAALFGLIPVLLNRLYLWLYNTLSVSSSNVASIDSFRRILGLAVFLVIGYLSALCMPLYFALRAKNHPHALSRALTLFAHPIHLIKSYFMTCWILICIRIGLLRIATFFGDAQIYAEYVVVFLLAPLTALLTLAYCDAACTDEPHAKPDHEVMEELP